MFCSVVLFFCLQLAASGQTTATTADPVFPVSVSLSTTLSSCTAGQEIVLSGSAQNATTVFLGVIMGVTATIDDGNPDDDGYLGGNWQTIITYPANKVLTCVSVMLWLDPSVWSPGGFVTENCGDLAQGQSFNFFIPVTAVAAQTTLQTILKACVDGALDTYTENGSLVLLQIGG